jgi:uncharacterized protein (TIGR00251 family)
MEIKVNVKTNKNKQEIEKIDANNYIISLKSSPIENKANKELIKLFSKELKLRVKIKKGLKSKEKLLEII